MQKTGFFFGIVLIIGLLAAGCTSTTPQITTPPTQTAGAAAASSGASATAASELPYMFDHFYGYNDGATKSNVFNEVKFGVVKTKKIDGDYSSLTLVFTRQGAAPITYTLGTAGKDNNYYSLTDSTSGVTLTQLTGSPNAITFYTGSANELSAGDKFTVELKLNNGQSISIIKTVPEIYGSAGVIP